MDFLHKFLEKRMKSVDEDTRSRGILVIACALLAVLLVLVAWVTVNLSGLMAARTGIREGYWVFLSIVTTVAFALPKTGGVLQAPRILGRTISWVYLVNGLIMLWPERPALFWVLVIGSILEIISTFWNRAQYKKLMEEEPIYL